MSHEPGTQTNPPRPTNYQIKIKGVLSDQWFEWFEGLTIKPDEEGNTLLYGPIVDDAALHGLLKKVRDLGMGLLSVNRLEAVQVAEDRRNKEKGKGE